MRLKISILFLLLLFGCSQKPLISLKDIKIEGFKKNDINLKIFLNVENPNNYSMEIIRANYEVYYKNNVIGTGNWQGPKILEGKSTTVIGLPVLIKNENLMDVLGLLINSQLLGNDEPLNNVSIKGNVVIKKLFYEKEIDFQWKYKSRNKEKARS
ncbi:MAG: LEA type 2 family protein [Proteobacteria bacterium]|nr:LEA type 2 family protein [Pseudomonadota bacterium]